MADPHEFDTGDLEGLALYLLARADGLTRKKRELLEGYAATARNAADRIVKLERRVSRKKKAS